jgi:hypothetical protein
MLNLWQALAWVWYRQKTISNLLKFIRALILERAINTKTISCCNVQHRASGVEASVSSGSCRAYCGSFRATTNISNGKGPTGTSV